jgi:signal transduction histidine kinase
MNRLWVRLSLMISGVLFLMFFMQFLAITLEQSQLGGFPGPRPDGPAPQAEIQGRLLEFMAFSLLVGTAGGVVIARVVSVPVNRIAQAAQRLGKGELDVRVPMQGSREMVELGETFNTMAANLKHATDLRNNLMADVSHELRTPLTVLEGNLRAVLDHVMPLEEAEIANLYGQTRHLTRLVNDLRELSLAESGQMPLEMVPCNLNVIAAEILQALEPLSAEKEILLQNEVPPLPEIEADPTRIRQLLYNLLSNALRHTPPGGKIILTGDSQNQRICLSVADTGEGLDPEQLASVFDRFYRGDKSRSRETGGSGLGLAIVKAIIEAQGGRVEVSSSGKGQGSTFTIYFPLQPIDPRMN